MKKVTFKNSIKAGLFAAGTAIFINAVLFYIFQTTGTINDSIFVQPNQPLTVVPVIISSLLPTLIASLFFFLFEKFTNNGFKIFRIVSIVLGLISLAIPFMTIQGVSIGYAIVLDLMHVVLVAALLFFINKEVKAVK